MNWKAREYIKQANEVQTFFAIQVKLGWIERNSELYHQSRNLMNQPLPIGATEQEIQLLRVNKFRCTQFVNDYLDVKKQIDLLKKQLATECEVISHADFDIWLGFWQQYTIQMSYEQIQDMGDRLLEGEDASEYMPNMTWKEWHNAKIKKKTNDIKIKRQ